MQWSSSWTWCTLLVSLSKFQVHLSFVRSLDMDSWNENEVKAMRVGGNQALLDFFQRHNISRQAPISVKYKTETASLYREMYVFLQ